MLQVIINKAGILFLTAAMTLIALPGKAQDSQKEKEAIAAAYEAEAAAWAATHNSAGYFRKQTEKFFFRTAAASFVVSIGTLLYVFEWDENSDALVNTKRYKQANKILWYSLGAGGTFSILAGVFSGETHKESIYREAMQESQKNANDCLNTGKCILPPREMIEDFQMKRAVLRTSADKARRKNRKNQLSRAAYAWYSAAQSLESAWATVEQERRLAAERGRRAERKRQAARVERIRQTGAAAEHERQVARVRRIRRAIVGTELERQAAAELERRAERKRQALERERQRQAAERERQRQAAERERQRQATEREQQRQAAERERQRQEAERIRQAVARAYEVQALAWDAEADYDFVEYDGWNSDKKSNASGARINASRARNGDSFAQRQASNAHLHILRARENASDMRRNARFDTGGKKELANKAATAWERAARAWEAVVQ